MKVDRKDFGTHFTLEAQTDDGKTLVTTEGQPAVVDSRTTRDAEMALWRLVQKCVQRPIGYSNRGIA